MLNAERLRLNAAFNIIIGLPFAERMYCSALEIVFLFAVLYLPAARQIVQCSVKHYAFSVRRFKSGNNSVENHLHGKTEFALSVRS